VRYRSSLTIRKAKEVPRKQKRKPDMIQTVTDTHPYATPGVAEK
jgi:hypothetical protein